jgi:hypothetical protein
MPLKKPTSRDTKRRMDEKLDQALKDSFPSSDPISFVEPAAEEPQHVPANRARKPGGQASRSR